jgi:hypothetical protein
MCRLVFLDLLDAAARQIARVGEIPSIFARERHAFERADDRRLHTPPV